MSPAIIQTSTYSLQILSHHPTGIVHSVYRKTINLSLGDTLLALQAADSVLSPLSLRTGLSQEQMAALPICTGQPVRATQAAIEITTESETIRFSLPTDPCAVLDLHLHALSGAVDASAFAAALRPVLTATTVGGFSGLLVQPTVPKDDRILQAARQILTDAWTAYAHQNWAVAADTLVHLIGLGGGLTPSGDDFLCGVLAGLILLNQWESPFGHFLRDRINEHLSDTLDLSRAFLTLALQGQFSLPVQSLKTLDPGQEGLTQSLRASFERIGHSSGMDTLSGLYYIASAVNTQP